MFNLYLLSILRIQCAKYDCVDIVVPPEKEPEQTQEGVCSEKKKLHVCVYDVKFAVLHSLPLVVGEGDSLRGHFEVDYGRGRWRVGAQSHGGGFLHRLDAGE